MNNLQLHWQNLSQKYGLSVEIPFTLTVEGQSVEIDVLLRGYGYKNGMLLVRDYGLIEEYADELPRLGYGFSTLSIPDEPEQIDEDSLKEMLIDWGWNGVGNQPLWLGT